MPQFRTWMLSSTNRCGLTVLLPKQSQYCFGFSSPHLEVLSVLQIVIQYILCPYSWVCQDYSGVLLLAFVYWVILFSVFDCIAAPELFPAENVSTSLLVVYMLWLDLCNASVSPERLLAERNVMLLSPPEWFCIKVRQQHHPMLTHSLIVDGWLFMNHNLDGLCLLLWISWALAQFTLKWRQCVLVIHLFKLKNRLCCRFLGRDQNFGLCDVWVVVREVVTVLLPWCGHGGFTAPVHEAQECNRQDSYMWLDHGVQGRSGRGGGRSNRGGWHQGDWGEFWHT